MVTGHLDQLVENRVWQKILSKPVLYFGSAKGLLLLSTKRAFTLNAYLVCLPFALTCNSENNNSENSNNFMLEDPDFIGL